MVYVLLILVRIYVIEFVPTTLLNSQRLPVSFHPQAFLTWGRAVSLTVWRGSRHAMLESRGASPSESEIQPRKYWFCVKCYISQEECRTWHFNTIVKHKLDALCVCVCGGCFVLLVCHWWEKFEVWWSWWSDKTMESFFNPTLNFIHLPFYWLIWKSALTPGIAYFDYQLPLCSTSPSGLYHINTIQPDLMPFLRSMQDVHIFKNMKLLDSPGIVAAPSNPVASMALRSLQVEEGQESVLEAVRTLLKQCDKTQVGGLLLVDIVWPLV